MHIMLVAQNSTPNLVYTKLFSTSGMCIWFTNGYSLHFYCLQVCSSKVRLGGEIAGSDINMHKGCWFS